MCVSVIDYLTIYSDERYRWTSKKLNEHIPTTTTVKIRLESNTETDMWNEWVQGWALYGLGAQLRNEGGQIWVWFGPWRH